MRARYLGDHDNFTSWGISFPRGVFVEVSDAHAQKKIAGNSHFEVDDSEEVSFVETKVEEITTAEGDLPYPDWNPEMPDDANNQMRVAAGLSEIHSHTPSSDAEDEFSKENLEKHLTEQASSLAQDKAQSYSGAKRGPKPKAK